MGCCRCSRRSALTNHNLSFSATSEAFFSPLPLRGEDEGEGNRKESFLTSTLTLTLSLPGLTTRHFLERGGTSRSKSPCAPRFPLCQRGSAGDFPSAARRRSKSAQGSGQQPFFLSKTVVQSEARGRIFVILTIFMQTLTAIHRQCLRIWTSLAMETPEATRLARAATIWARLMFLLTSFSS